MKHTVTIAIRSDAEGGGESHVKFDVGEPGESTAFEDTLPEVIERFDKLWDAMPCAKDQG